MKILIVSYYFAPYNCIGSVRVSKLAKYWTGLGHDVKVLAAKDLPISDTLPLEIKASKVFYTSWFNVNWLPELFLGGRDKIKQQGYQTKNSWLSQLGNLYKTLFNFPDAQIGWRPKALKQGKQLLTFWKPDFIYASAMPFSSLLVAHRLSKIYQIPWIAELRDLWVDGHSYNYPHFRCIFEEFLERRTLSTASGLVTVSEPLAETLRNKYNLPVAVVINGYDKQDFPKDINNNENQEFDSNCINILYTGMIYKNQRDPSPLFAAMASLGDQAKSVRVHFYGRYIDHVILIAKSYKVEQLVKIHKPIPYKKSLYLQTKADILLLLLWDDPAEKGVYTGKLFEYIGARRPILAIGPKDNVAAELIEERGAGFVCKDHLLIAEKIKHWIEIKQKNNEIPSLEPSVGSGLERKDSFDKLTRFLDSILKKKN